MLRSLAARLFRGVETENSSWRLRPVPRNRRRHLGVESLDCRRMLTSQLYLDFGDAFPKGGLGMTVTQLASTFANGGLQGPDLAAAGLQAATPIKYTPLSKLVTFDYNKSGSVNTQDYTDLRNAVVSLVQRYYAGLDVNVRIAPTLDNTSASSYFGGIQTTLQQGSSEVGEGDAWIFVTQVDRTDLSTNPLGVPVVTSIGQIVNKIAGYGLSPSEPTKTNVDDNTALVFADTLLAKYTGSSAATALAKQVASEAARTFGLRPSSQTTFNYDSPNVPVVLPDLGSAVSTIVVPSHQTIADLNVGFTMYHNWDIDIRATLISPAGTAVLLTELNGGNGDNYINTIFDDEATISITAGQPPFTGSFRPMQSLSAFDGQDMFGTWTLAMQDLIGVGSGLLTAWSIINTLPTYPLSADDQLLMQTDVMSDPDQNIAMFARYPLYDPSSGIATNEYDALSNPLRLGPTGVGAGYVTGTGAHDRIVITPSGPNSAQVSVTAYRTTNRTSPITVPGKATVTYTYSIDTSYGILIDGGGGNDLIEINGAFATGITIRGMAGIDDVLVNGGGGTAVYTPNSTSPVGLDDRASYGGTISVGATQIKMSELELSTDLSFNSYAKFTARMPNGSDVLTYDSPGAGVGRFNGTSGGVSLIPIKFNNIGNVILDSQTFDTAASADTIYVNASPSAAGIPLLSIFTGAGNDTIWFPVLPTNGSTLAFDGGTGTDRVAILANQAQYNVAATALTSSAGGTVQYYNIESADITGGSSNNTFAVNSWGKSATLTLDGGAGNDEFDIGKGDIGSVLGKISLLGNSGSDLLSIQDSLATGNFDYYISKNVVTTMLGKSSRAFTSLTFDDKMEYVTLDASAGSNRVNVQVSRAVEFSLNGGAPTTANADVLVTDVYGTIGRKLNYDQATGSGSWVFHGSLYGPGNYKPIGFTGFEKVVNPLAFSGAATDANTLGQPLVRYLDLASGENTTFLAYESTFKFGVRTITADLNNDGQLEVVTAPVRGRAAEIRVFSGKGVENKAFRTLTYAANFLGGVNIAVADVNGDKLPDLIAVPALGRAEVRIYLNQGGKTFAKTPAYQFYAFPPQYIGGATVAAGDFNGDGRAEIVVGSGVGKAASVVVFDPRGITGKGVSPTPLYQYTNFFATSFLGGIGSVVVARANADSTPDIIVTQGNGGKSLVATLDGVSGRRAGNGYAKTKVLYSFAAYADTHNFAAVTAVVRDVDQDGIVDTIFTGQSSDGKTRGVLRQFKMYTNVAIDNPLFGNPKFFGYAVG